MVVFAKNLEQLQQLAEYAFQEEDWLRATKYWQKIVRRYNKTAPPESWLWLARCYVNEGKLDKAEVAISDGIARKPNRTKLLMLAGKIAMANKDWQLAKERWASILKNLQDEAPPNVWSNLAKAERLLGQLEQAEDTAKRGLVVHKGHLDTLIERAETATAKKDWRTAVRFWAEALAVINKQDNPNLLIKQHIRLNLSLIKRLLNIGRYKKEIKEYAQSKKVRNVAVITSMTKGYDTLKPPEVLDDRFDYIVYTNDKLDNLGIFDIRPLPKPELDDARAIRYVKTHPHTLLGNYEAVVWVDSSLMLVGDIYPLIKKFLDSKKAIGSGVHPLRKNIYEEFEANVRLGKENSKIMKRQIDFYKSQGFEHNDLSENTLLMFNPQNKKLAPALEAWWEQICRFSRRDQLSFNYSLAQNGVDWFRLTRSPENIRNHPNFVITPHHSDSQVLAELVKALKS